MQPIHTPDSAAPDAPPFEPSSDPASEALPSPPVGYASPPAHSRWQAGQSGNPAGGRPGPRGPHGAARRAEGAIARKLEKALRRPPGEPPAEAAEAAPPPETPTARSLADLAVEGLVARVRAGDVRAMVEVMRSLRMAARDEARRWREDARDRAAAEAEAAVRAEAEALANRPKRRLVFVSPNGEVSPARDPDAPCPPPPEAAPGADWVETLARAGARPGGRFPEGGGW